jgi:hypothetical protein
MGKDSNKDVVHLVSGALLSVLGYIFISASAVPDSERYLTHRGHWCFECNKPATRTKTYTHVMPGPGGTVVTGLEEKRVWLCDDCDPSELSPPQSKVEGDSDLEGRRSSGHEGWKWEVGIVSFVLGLLFFFGGLGGLCRQVRSLST